MRLSLRKAHGVYQRHKPPQEIGANGAPKAFIAGVLTSAAVTEGWTERPQVYPRLTLPKDLIGFEGHRSPWMIRHDAWGVVASRAACRDLGRVAYDSLCSGAPIGNSHGLDSGFAFSQGVGIELYPQVTKRKITR